VSTNSRSRITGILCGKALAGAGALALLAGLAASAWFLFDVHPSSERLRYTSDGRLESRRSPNGETIRYEYDPLGRLKRIRKSLLSDVKFEYNPASDLLSVESGSGKISFDRDPLGRPNRITWPGERSVSYEYDPWGRVVSLSSSDGYRVLYTRNILGHLTSVDDGHGRTSYEYSAGTVVRQLPNGIRTTFRFLPSGRPASIAHRYATGDLIVSFEYAYRPDVSRPRTS
jgi:YD repeat-containing protein